MKTTTGKKRTNRAKRLRCKTFYLIQDFNCEGNLKQFAEFKSVIGSTSKWIKGITWHQGVAESNYINRCAIIYDESSKPSL